MSKITSSGKIGAGKGKGKGATAEAKVEGKGKGKGKGKGATAEAPAAETSGRRGRALQWGPDAKIKVLEKDHAFREGSIRAESFALMQEAPTVGAYLEKGGRAKHLTRFSDLEIISIG